MPQIKHGMPVIRAPPCHLTIVMFHTTKLFLMLHKLCFQGTITCAALLKHQQTVTAALAAIMSNLAPMHRSSDTKTLSLVLNPICMGFGDAHVSVSKQAATEDTACCQACAESMAAKVEGDVIVQELLEEVIAAACTSPAYRDHCKARDPCVEHLGYLHCTYFGSNLVVPFQYNNSAVRRGWFQSGPGKVTHLDPGVAGVGTSMLCLHFNSRDAKISLSLHWQGILQPLQTDFLSL